MSCHGNGEAPVNRPADAVLSQAANHVLARYAWAIDDCDYGDLLDIFTVDAVSDYGTFTCHSAEELVVRMEDLHRGLRATQHLVGSVHAVAVPDGSVLVRSHVRATLVRSGGPEGRVEVAASYRDLMVPGVQGLQVARRTVRGHWIAGERSILPWIDERTPGASRSGEAPAARSQTTSTARRYASPDDRGV